MPFSSTTPMASNVTYMGGMGINMPDTSAVASSGFTPQTVAMGAQAVGGVAQAIGAYDSTAARRNMLGMDAQIAQLQGSQALAAGQAQEEDSRLQSGQLFGRQRAQLAANGVQLGSGSALDLLTGTKVIGNIDATTIHNNALRAAWGYQTQSDIDRYAASNLNPTTTALTTLLGSAGSVANSWYRYNNAMNGAPVPTS